MSEIVWKAERNVRSKSRASSPNVSQDTADKFYI